jgi:Restriction endonuclease
MGEDAEAEITGDEELPQGSLGSISFANLDETDFEEFCYDLLFQLGFVNIDWRKGTPKKASPADRGRDIVAQLEHVDVDGHKYFDTWFIDCKHYKRGVPPEALQGLTTWAEAERPGTALVIPRDSARTRPRTGSRPTSSATRPSGSAILGQLLEPVDRRQHRRQRQRRAPQIQAPRRRITELRQQAAAPGPAAAPSRASPTEVTSRSIVDPLRRKDFATV